MNSQNQTDTYLNKCNHHGNYLNSLYMCVPIYGVCVCVHTQSACTCAYVHTILREAPKALRMLSENYTTALS